MFTDKQKTLPDELKRKIMAAKKKKPGRVIEEANGKYMI
tara:strand:- start:124 stop:240 length:117 start_codon:yes stop_codon:yes gene_type:complete